MQGRREQVLGRDFDESAVRDAVVGAEAEHDEEGVGGGEVEVFVC